MISLREQITIPFAPALVWSLLSDPETFASCIPGVSVTASGKTGVHGSIRVPIGTMTTLFRGEATLVYDKDKRQCSITVRGGEARGRSRLVADATVTVSGGSRTLLEVTATLDITGPLQEAFAGSPATDAPDIVTRFAEVLTRLAAMPGTPVLGAETIPLIEWEDFEATPGQPQPIALAQPSRIASIFGGMRMLAQWLVPRLS